MHSVLQRLLLCLVAVTALGCHHESSSEPSTSKPPTGVSTPEKRLTVSYSEGRRYSLHRTLALVATVVADKSLAVPSRATGEIVRVLVVEGDRVQAGQVLATVDTSDAQLAVKQAQAELASQLAVLGLRSPQDRLRSKDQVPSVIKAKAMMDNADQVYERYRGLHKEHLVSDVELSNQRAAYIAAKADYEAAIESVNQSMAAVEAAKLAVEIAQKKVTEAVIKAPLAGIVNSVTTATGAYVSSGSDSGITLLKVRPLFLSVEIPQEQLSEFALGEVLSFTIPGFPDRRLGARVTEMGAALSAKSDALSARARVISPPDWLQPGMAAEVQLKTGDEPNQVLVPQAAVLTQAGQSSLFVVTAKSGKTATVAKRPIVLGAILQDWVIVKKGDYEPDMTVVTSDLLALKTGDRVELAEQLTIAEPESPDEP